MLQNGEKMCHDRLQKRFWSRFGAFVVTEQPVQVKSEARGFLTFLGWKSEHDDSFLTHLYFWGGFYKMNTQLLVGVYETENVYWNISLKIPFKTSPFMFTYVQSYGICLWYAEQTLTNEQETEMFYEVLFWFLM